MTLSENFYDVRKLLHDKSFVFNFIGTTLGAAAVFTSAIVVSSASKIPIQPLALVVEAIGKSDKLTSIEKIGQRPYDKNLGYVGWQASLREICSLDDKDINTISAAFQRGTAKLVVREDGETTIADATKIGVEVCNQVRRTPAKYKDIEAIFPFKEPALGDKQAVKTYRIPSATENNWPDMGNYLRLGFERGRSSATPVADNERDHTGPTELKQ